jgi:chromosomal replication initiation ATPase DnaA
VLNNEFASAFAKTINSILNTKFNIVFVAKNLVTVPNVSTTQSQNSPTAIGINKHYRFDNLVIAEFNKTAYNAVQSLLKKTY